MPAFRVLSPNRSPRRKAAPGSRKTSRWPRGSVRCEAMAVPTPPIGSSTQSSATTIASPNSPPRSASRNAAHRFDSRSPRKNRPRVRRTVTASTASSFHPLDLPARRISWFVYVVRLAGSYSGRVPGSNHSNKWRHAASPAPTLRPSITTALRGQIALRSPSRNPSARRTIALPFFNQISDSQLRSPLKRSAPCL